MPEATNWLRVMRDRSAGRFEISEDGVANFGRRAGFLELAVAASDLADGDDAARFYGRLRISRNKGRAARLVIQTIGGSYDAPSALLAGDGLAVIDARGYDGAAVVQGSRIEFVAGSNWSETNREAGMIFRIVVPDTTAAVAAMRLVGEGSLVVGDAATPGADFEAGVVFGTTAGVDPSTSVDRVHAYGHERSAGNRQFAVFQEAAVVEGADVASTHKIPVRWNGADMFLLASNV